MHKLVYNLGPRSAAFKLMPIDTAIWQRSSDAFTPERMDGEDVQYAVDLAIALSKIRIKGRRGRSPLVTPGCRYHDHVAEQHACYKTMI